MRLTQLTSKSVLRIRLSYKKLTPYLFLSLSFFIIVIPLVLKEKIKFYGSDDEKVYYPLVRTFVVQFPALDFDYASDTTPLAFILLMFSAFLVGDGLIQIRFVNALLSLVCLLVVYTYLSKRGGALKGLFFSMIFMLSYYFIGPAIRVSTDNTALLFVFLSMMMIDTNVFNIRHFFWANVFILFAVLTRQIYAWLVGAALLIGLHDQENKRLRISMEKILPSFIPITGLAAFILLWGGLLPSGAWDREIAWLNRDVPLYVISLIGLYGTFFFPWYLRLYKQKREKTIYVVSLVALGVVCLLIHPLTTEYGPNEVGNWERGGSLFLIAPHIPTLFSSSIIYWFLFPLGIIWLYMTIRNLLSGRDYLMAICFPLWLSANMASARTYQRYYEPFLIFFIAYSLTTMKGERWYDWIGPSILAVGFVGIALFRFFL